MSKLQTPPWSPVRAPRIKPLEHPRLSLTAGSRLNDMARREHQFRCLNRSRALWGLAIIALITGPMVPFLTIILARMQPALHPDLHSHPPPQITLYVVLIIDSLLLLATFPIAMLTAPHSRADRVKQFLDTGSRSTGSKDDPFVRFVLTLLMLGLLYGEFLIVDALKSLLLRFRLRNIDRHRAAVILQMLVDEPRGIDPRLLLQIGENPLHLRRLLSYLMIYEWAGISPHGDWLTILSPSRRELRKNRVDPLIQPL